MFPFTNLCWGRAQGTCSVSRSVGYLYGDVAEDTISMNNYGEIASQARWIYLGILRHARVEDIEKAALLAHCGCKV